MTKNRLQAISGVSAAAITLLFGSARSDGQEIDFEYRCVIIESPSSTDQTTTLPEGLTQVDAGNTFYVEFWATDSGTTNTGLVSVYADLNYPEEYAAIAAGPSCSPLFITSFFCSGTDDGSMIDELGGSQLDPDIGIEPMWARVAFVEFAATASGQADFVLRRADGESSAYNRGLIPSSDIAYGSCDVWVKCPDGPMAFMQPTSPMTDAGQPHPIDDAGAAQGYQVFAATGPSGAADMACWSFDETNAGLCGNFITGVVEEPPSSGNYEIALDHPLQPGAITTITYSWGDGSSTGEFTALPGDADASGETNPADIGALIDCLIGGTCKSWECDIDRLGGCAGADLERLIDLLNNAGQFTGWNGATPALEACPTITRTNLSVRSDGLMHASESGRIIAFEYRDADSDLTVGYWHIAAGARGPDVLVPGFNNTAGVSDPSKPAGNDFACLNGKILVSDGGFGQLALYDTSNAISVILDLPGTRTTNPQSRVASDGGRYGAAIIEGKLTDEFSEQDRPQVVAIDSDTNTVIEFGDAAATGEPRDDYRAVAVWGSEVALLANIDETGTDTVMVFDVNDPDAAPQSFQSTMDLTLDSAAFDFDGTYVLLYNGDDNLVILDTDTGVYSITATNNVAKSSQTGGATESQESIEGGVFAYLSSDGGFGATSLASVGTAGGSTATVADTDATSGNSPAGHGNTIVVTTSGRVFSAGVGDISTQGGNLSEVTSGAAVFVSDLVGDAVDDGFIAASDIFVTGNLVYFKSGLDGNNNASQDTVLSFFSAP